MRVLLVLAVWLLHAAALAQDCAPPPSRGDGWQVAAPEAVGLDGARLCAIAARVAGAAPVNIHAVLVVRRGRLVFERYFPGSDERWGRPLGQVAFGPETLHDMRSVTKSVTALLVGIALERGLIAGVDEPILRFLPQYSELRAAAPVTLRHLLTMSGGQAWDETRSYGDPQNSWVQARRAEEPLRFILAQPRVAPPGERYNYNSGGTLLLGAALERATGQPVETFAREALFEPLGIRDAEWRRFPGGQADTGAGLRLRPRDLARIGRLVLDGGTAGGRRVVPAAWIREMTAPRLVGQGLFFYGYQWWLGRSLVEGREIAWVGAFGFGGQRLFVVPDLELAAVVTAGLYLSPQQGAVPLELLNRHILAAVRDGRR